MSSPTRKVNLFSPGLSDSTNDQRPLPSATLCSSNHSGTSRVMVALGWARPRMMIVRSALVEPSAGSRMIRPKAGGVGVGDGLDVGVGGGVGLGEGVGNGVGLGLGVGLGDGLGVGDGVGEGVGLGLASAEKVGFRVAVATA